MDDHREKELLDFLHRHKNQLSCSCAPNPEIFVRELWDRGLITEDIYQTYLYETLDWIEKNKRTLIHDFWCCVFKKHIMEEYPRLKELQTLFNKAGLNVYSKDGDDRPGVESPGSVCDEEQPGGPSDATQTTQGTSSSRVAKGRIAVTCEDKEVYMDLNKFKNGRSECIRDGRVWRTPTEFARLEGKTNQRWARILRYKNKPLENFTIKDGQMWRKEPKRKGSAKSAP